MQKFDHVIELYKSPEVEKWAFISTTGKDNRITLGYRETQKANEHWPYDLQDEFDCIYDPDTLGAKSPVQVFTRNRGFPVSYRRFGISYYDFRVEGTEILRTSDDGPSSRESGINPNAVDINRVGKLIDRLTAIEGSLTQAVQPLEGAPNLQLEALIDYLAAAKTAEAARQALDSTYRSLNFVQRALVKPGYAAL